MKQVFLSILAIIGLIACSESSSDNTYTQNDAQKVYNQMKGTYSGQILIDNTSTNVKIVLDNEFTIKQLPLKPIFQHAFTEKEDLEEALNVISASDFTTQTSTLNIIGTQALLTLKQADLIVEFKVKGIDHRIITTFQSEVFKFESYNSISVNLKATELNFDGKMCDLTREPVIYFIDGAQRVKEKAE